MRLQFLKEKCESGIRIAPEVKVEVTCPHVAFPVSAHNSLSLSVGNGKCGTPSLACAWFYYFKGVVKLVSAKGRSRVRRLLIVEDPSFPIAEGFEAVGHRCLDRYDSRHRSFISIKVDKGLPQIHKAAAFGVDRRTRGGVVSNRIHHCLVLR